MREHIDVVAPSPRRLVESLRDTGYSHQAAFADIVDNSIAAEASYIAIDIEESIFGNEITVSFFDNGNGMDAVSIKEAMRYGSEKRPSPKSLGKFGMGLKTASTAFCRKLTVISKQGLAIEARCWDVDLIIECDDWVLTKPDVFDYAAQIEKLTQITGTDGSGTVVIWENVDRLINSSGTDYIRESLVTLIEEIRDHLAGTFGKFLIGREAFRHGLSAEPSPDVIIELNGEPIKGWDPTGQFLNTVEEPDRVISEKKVHVFSNLQGKSSRFELNGYVLPNKNKMTDEELAAIKFSNDNQGFYIYREDRLIFGGGWPHRLFSQDAHLNLLRVELNFDHNLDDTFEIDIRKSKINLPLKIRNEFKKALAPWRNEASRRYRQNSKVHRPLGTSDEPADINLHKDSSRAIKRQRDKSTKVNVVSVDGQNSRIIIENRFGETEINRAAVVAGTDILVTTVASLEGGMLWKINMTEDDQTVVVLNEGHEFYRRFYLSTEASPVLIQAMDSLFWALANAELNSISDISKNNFEELRFSLSDSLRHLASELPDAD